MQMSTYLTVIGPQFHSCMRLGPGAGELISESLSGSLWQYKARYWSQVGWFLPGVRVGSGHQAIDQTGPPT